MSKRTLLAGIAILTASSLFGYTRFSTSEGIPQRRVDTAAIRFLINDQIRPGMTNSEGQLWITADSDPVGALRAAVATWDAVTTANLTFAPVGATTLLADGFDENHVFVFDDTPANRGIIGDANAVTLGFFTSEGIITDTDILFNPVVEKQGQQFPFGTNGADNMFDIEAIALHELGHALGVGHTSVLSGTMFQSGKPADTQAATLDHDDLAVISSIYSASGNATIFGAVSGRATFTGGGPIRAGAVTVVDPVNGTAISVLSSPQDGAFQIDSVPPGTYQLFIEPLNGPARPGNLRLMDSDADTAFQTTFLGGNNSPSTIQVQAGLTTSADISAPAGDSPVEIQLLGKEVGGGAFSFSSIAQSLEPGSQTELVIIGPGVGQADLSILGNAVQLTGPTEVINFTDGTQGLSAPVQVVAGATLKEAGRRGQNAVADAVATLVLNSGGAVSVFTSGLIVPNVGAPAPPRPAFTSAGVVSAASFLGGGVAPGEIVSIFGADMGPAAGAQPAGFDPASGLLGSSLAGVTVTLDGTPGPLFFVSAGQINVQVPFEVAGRANTTVVVAFNGLVSSAAQVPVVASHPALFVNQGSAIVVHNDDGSLNSPANPIQRGKAVLLFGSGQGVVAPAVATGQPAPGSPLSVVNGLQLNLGGVSSTPFFAGLAPNFVGLLQVNAIIPPNAPTGNTVPLSVSIQGGQSQPGMTIAIAP